MTTDNDPPAKSSEDLVFIHGVTEDGKGLEVIRKRADRLEAGLVRPLEPGKPIHGEVVKLKPRADTPYVCDVSVQYGPAGAGPALTSGASAAKEDPSDGAGQMRTSRADSMSHDTLRPTSKGPAQVANPTYRENWDRIWKRSGLPN